MYVCGTEACWSRRFVVVYVLLFRLRFTWVVPAVRQVWPRLPGLTCSGICLMTDRLQFLRLVCPVGPPASRCTECMLRLVRTRVFTLQLWVLTGSLSLRPVLIALCLVLRSRQVRSPRTRLTLWFLRFCRHSMMLWLVLFMVVTVVRNRGL